MLFLNKSWKQFVLHNCNDLPVLKLMWWKKNPLNIWMLFYLSQTASSPDTLSKLQNQIKQARQVIEQLETDRQLAIAEVGIYLSVVNTVSIDSIIGFQLCRVFGLRR